MKVEIFADITCPWCYIGERRFENALARYDGRHEVDVVYRPFQLDPSAPATARPLAEYLARRFGQIAGSVTQRVGAWWHLLRARTGTDRRHAFAGHSAAWPQPYQRERFG